MSTIAAIVTPLAQAAVSIIRISGDNSWQIAEKLTGKSFEAGCFKLCWIIDKSQAKAIKLDQALVLAFRGPKSYTGEDVIEIHCHGGVWVTQKILELILEAGAKPAKPGEFTERAFLNHKIDLSQAEAILDIISARTDLAGDNAAKLYQGFLGKEILSIRASLIELLGELTAGIDFPDEVGDLDYSKFNSVIENSIEKIDQLLTSEKHGHILRHGYKIALVGDPNAGKSSLLNALLKSDRAIVTDIEGTTRDTIEESFNLKGIPVVFVDTAGIRRSEDLVEQIGIERSKQAIEEADLVLQLYDLEKLQENSNSLEMIEVNDTSKQCLKIATKLDLLKEMNETDGFEVNGQKIDLCLSATKDINLDKLKDLIYQKINQVSGSTDTIKINHRQADLLRKSKTALEKSLEASKEKLPQDFWTIDLKASITALGEITGDVVTEELLDNIFSSFCIGK